MTHMWLGLSDAGIRYRKGDVNFLAPICQTTIGFLWKSCSSNLDNRPLMHLHTNRENVGSGQSLLIWIGVLFHNYYSKCGYPYLMKTLSVQAPPVPLNTVLLTKSPFVLMSLCELRLPPLQRYRAILCTILEIVIEVSCLCSNATFVHCSSVM